MVLNAESNSRKKFNLLIRELPGEDPCFKYPGKPSAARRNTSFFVPVMITFALITRRVVKLEQAFPAAECSLYRLCLIVISSWYSSKSNTASSQVKDIGWV
jgi:hypothetical protein